MHGHTRFLDLTIFALKLILAFQAMAVVLVAPRKDVMVMWGLALLGAGAMWAAPRLSELLQPAPARVLTRR